jgi:hypothetical protein
MVFLLQRRSRASRTGAISVVTPAAGYPGFFCRARKRAFFWKGAQFL